MLGDEDCLYINVYVPRIKLSTSDNLNVIVHIHGGSFMIMSSHFYSGPKFLMDEEVILVTMNYRLGPFGFLSTQDDVLPGNNGMKDQVLALKWIQKNIKFFGGNPDSVTITGMSAGGASVHLHYFSQLSKGLFHRGVSQSGTALNAWVIQEDALEKAKRVAELVGCPSETSKLIVDCLKSRSANKITDAVEAMGMTIFTPVVEKEHAEAFLTEHPSKMLNNKLVSDVPWVASVTDEEGSSIINYMGDQLLSNIYENFEVIGPQLFVYDYIRDESEKASITNKIKEYYFKESPNKDELIKLFGDRMFVAGADLSSKMQAKLNKSPVYFYKFGYRGQHSFAEFLMENADDIDTASHGDDIQYYLHTTKAEETLSETDEKMKSVFLQWLIAFANNQELIVNGVIWKPVTGSEMHEFLYIQNPDEIHMEVAESLGSSSFWSKLPLSENKHATPIRDEF